MTAAAFNVSKQTSNAILKYGGAIVGASFLTSAFQRAVMTLPESTGNRQWEERTESLLKAQDMNPVGIGGRKAYTPSYMK